MCQWRMFSETMARVAICASCPPPMRANRPQVTASAYQTVATSVTIRAARSTRACGQALEITPSVPAPCRAPVHGRPQRLAARTVRMPLGNGQQRVDERVRQKVRLQAEILQGRVRHLVAVLLELDARVVEVLDRDGIWRALGDRVRDLADGHRLR